MPPRNPEVREAAHDLPFETNRRLSRRVDDALSDVLRVILMLDQEAFVTYAETAVHAARTLSYPKLKATLGLYGKAVDHHAPIFEVLRERQKQAA